MPTSTIQRNTLIGFISILLWGCIIPLIRLVSEKFGTLGAIAVVQGLGGVLGLSVIIARGTLPKNASTYLSGKFFIRSFLFSSQIFLIYYAIAIVDRAVLPGVIFCNYLWPTLVLLYSVLIAGVKVTRLPAFLAGIVLVLIALFTEFGNRGIAAASSNRDSIAFLLAILSANCWAFYSAFTRRYGEVSGGSSITPLFQLLSAIIAAVLIFAGVGGEELAISSGVSWPLIATSFSNFIAYLCWDVGVRYGSVVVLSLCADFIPWLSLFSTSLLLGIPIPDHTKISAVLLVIGAITTRFGTLPKRS